MASLLVVLTLAACGPNWQPVTLPQPKPLAERTVLEFRVRDTTVRLHAVRFERDSVSGIPWLTHTSCDSCRVRYATTEISGARVGRPETIGWFVFFVPLILLYSWIHAFDGLAT
jgi:hypothetical protein